MRSWLQIVGAILFMVAAATAQAAHTQASLLFGDETAPAGGTVLAGIRLRMDPDWHTYWKNSGASGIPTSIKWDLPEGISAGEIQWPIPQKFPPDDLVTYGYTNEVILLVPLTIAPGVKPGPAEAKAKVSWLECKEQCVPASAEVRAVLNVGATRKASDQAALLAAWEQKTPRPSTSASVRWERTVTNDVRTILLECRPPVVFGEADFFPHASEDYELEGATEKVPAAPGTIALRKRVKKFQGDWPKEISGVFIEGSGDKRLGFAVATPIAPQVPQDSAAGTVTGGAPNAAAALSQPLWRMLLYGFIGGLILNVMPCVLPVISLKILGFVRDAQSSPARVRRLGLMYGLGVLFSFLILAGIVIGFKAAGHRAGWGMQFSNPHFLVGLTVLVTLVALNLFGLFEVQASARILDAAGAASSKHGDAGAFFNGMLATVLATPCTAPYLGAALGFAFIQPAAVTLLVFVMVAIGLALPYVVLSWQPAWLKFLPRPGHWMERFKIAMGFPMLATAIWLCSLTATFYGDRAWWLGLFLVILALAAWIYGEFVQRGKSRRLLAIVAVLVLLIGGYAYAIQGQLRWSEPLTDSATTHSLRQSPDGIDWQRWDLRAVAHAQEEGHPVLVDFTADWCLTCQANKRIAIDIPSVRAKLKEIGAVSFIGDYTRLPEEMTAELNRYGRAGVPLVLVFPPKAGQPPIVLPELLTPGIVLDALNRAAK